MPAEALAVGAESPVPAMKALEAAAGWARPGQACLVQKACDDGRALIACECLGGA